MENSNTEKIIAAVLIGAAIGGALGIFFASDKGSELRKIIAGKTGDLTDSLKEKFNSLVDASKKEHGTKESATALANHLKEN